MNVSCPHCSTVFRVDPGKVPAGGARVRCSICRGIFAVGEEQREEAPAPAAVAEPPVERVPEPAPAPAPPPPAPAPPAAPPPPAPAPTGAARPPSPFGAADPHAKARRLARALVSDIVTYHPERRDTALREGTLKREFKEEITKSWEEYVAQVGPETARSTPFFRDALNDLLARGEKVF